MRKLNHPNRRLHNWLVYKSRTRLLIKNIENYRGVIFDLGCGESPYRAFFLQYADKYFGIDWSDSVHDTKAEIIADLNQELPVDTEVADTVVSFSVMEHLCEPQNMLNEAFRILRPGGAMVLQVPWQWRIHEAPHDYFRYTPYGLEHMLKKAGFQDIVIEAQSGVFTTIVMKFNYFTRRLISGPKPIRAILFTVFAPLWWLGQVLAPYLDKLDKNWSLESSGYFVTARKVLE